MKKIHNIWLMAALMCGLALSVTSCKDDDDDNNQSKTERETDTLLNTDEGQAATRLFQALAGITELPADWRSKTFDPDFGTVSEQNALRRLVIVADADEARLKFASLAGCSPDVLGQTYTATFEDMGSLTWDLTSGDEQLAIVKVSIRQMPRLQEIVYCTQDQLGKNGLVSKVKGTTYYRFGDVIRDADGYLWVCVRPAFEENNKEDSHWINIINDNDKPMAAANKEMKWDGGKWKKDVSTIILPTKLGVSFEHNYNLGQLIYALLNPRDYTTVAAQNGGKGLGGFSYTHHNEQFVEYVSNVWETKGLFKSFFQLSRSELQALSSLNFYYNGYSWGLFSGNKATLWLHKHTTYQAKATGSENQEKVTYDMTQGFDITRYTGASNAKSVAHPQIDGKAAYYVVRYAKGKALCSVGSYDYARKLGGTTTVWRYYERMDIDPGTPLKDAEAKETSNQAIAANDANVGNVVTWAGHVYKNYASARANEEEVVAVVTHRMTSQQRNEDGSFKPLLAIATADAFDKNDKDLMEWGPSGASGVTRLDNSSTTFMKTAESLIDGRKNTSILGSTATYTAAQACLNYESWRYIDFYKRGNLLSEFFLPCVGQYILMLKGLGVYEQSGNGAVVIEAINNLFQQSQSESTLPTDGTPIWTSTEASDTEAYVFIIDSKNGARFEKRPKSEKHKVYPFTLVG